MSPRRIFFTLLIGIFLVSMVPQVFGQDDPIQERKKLMKSNNKSAKALKKAIKANDYATIETNAKIIAANMKKLPDLFPKGTQAKISRAKPTIWNNWDDFSEKVRWAQVGANGLVEAAMAKDEPRMKLEYDAVSRSCRTCHRPYRARKKRKK